jgi:hypothetical protein
LAARHQRRRSFDLKVVDWKNLAVALTFTPAVLETDEWSPTLLFQFILPPIGLSSHQAHATQRSCRAGPNR